MSELKRGDCYIIFMKVNRYILKPHKPLRGDTESNTGVLCYNELVWLI
jgi:hypothetical protein